MYLGLQSGAGEVLQPHNPRRTADADEEANPLKPLQPLRMAGAGVAPNLADGAGLVDAVAIVVAGEQNDAGEQNVVAGEQSVVVEGAKNQ